MQRAQHRNVLRWIEAAQSERVWWRSQNKHGVRSSWSSAGRSHGSSGPHKRTKCTRGRLSSTSQAQTRRRLTPEIVHATRPSYRAAVARPIDSFAPQLLPDAHATSLHRRGTFRRAVSLGLRSDSDTACAASTPGHTRRHGLASNRRPRHTVVGRQPHTARRHVRVMTYDVALSCF